MALPGLLRRRPPLSTPFLGGHRVELLVDGGPYFAALLESIASARRAIFIESYIVRADGTGWRVARALAERAAAGVEVALAYDGYGSLGLAADLLDFLRQAGVKLLAFRPVSPLRGRWPWSKRNHRKLVAIDGRVGLVGGFNIGDEYAAPAEGGQGWRDTGVRIEGPAVASLEALFRRLWEREGGASLTTLAARASAPLEAGAQVRFLGNFAGRERAYIRRAYLLAIVSAQRTIRITNAYFVPDRVIRRALVRAARRGVQVELILAGKTDVPAAMIATRSYYGTLLRHGVSIHEWDERVLHAKTAVIDGEWSTVGSSNLDFLSSFTNLELNATIISRAVGAELDRQFLEDRARSRPIALAAWRRRSLVTRLLELVYRFLGRGY
jgi:cardiolipin synthase